MERVLLNSKEMSGDSSLRMSFISHVGAGSAWHVLFREELMSFSTSSLVTSLHSAIVGVGLHGASYSGVAAVGGTLELRWLCRRYIFLLCFFLTKLLISELGDQHAIGRHAHISSRSILLINLTEKKSKLASILVIALFCKWRIFKSEPSFKQRWIV